MTPNDWILAALKGFFAVAGLIAVVVYVLVPLWRKLRSGPDPDILNPQFVEPEEELEGELQIPVGGEGKTPDRATIIESARQDPRMTANMITRWLREKN